MDYSIIIKDIIEGIKNSKGKVVGSKEITSMIENHLEQKDDSIVLSQVKELLKASDEIDYFREGNCIHEDKFYWSAGNWFSLKGIYKNAIEAKSKIGLASWQRFADDTAPHLEI